MPRRRLNRKLKPKASKRFGDEQISKARPKKKQEAPKEKSPVQDRVRRINAQLIATEKRYGKDSQIMQRVYSTINMAQGTTGKTRFSTQYYGETFKQRAIFEQALSKVESSYYTTARGRKELSQKIFSSFEKTHSDWSAKKIDELFDFFEYGADMGRMRELAGEGYSEQLADSIALAKESGISNKEIEELFDTFMRASDEDRPNQFFDFLNSVSQSKDVKETVKEVIGKVVDD